MTRPSGRAEADAKVVVVLEDDLSIREMLVLSLGIQYRVYEAGDGEEGMRLLRTIPPPDLLLVDIMMPKVDGFSFAGQVKADPALKGIPIIFLTGLDSPKDVIRGINAGARHYITKPFKIADVLEKVGRTINTKRTSMRT